MLGIIEPKQQRSKIGDFAIKLGYSDFCHCNEVNNHIWLFWNNMASVQVLEVTPQTLYLKIGIPGMAKFLLSLVYAKCTRAERMELWEDLIRQSHSTLPWLVGGDFDTILSLTKKRGGVNPDFRSMHDFRNCLVASNLSDLGFEGNHFTWCIGQQGRSKIWEGLDRILCNMEAMVVLPALKVTHLTRIGSDHAPLLLRLDETPPYKSRFIFQMMWSEHPDFLRVVKEAWVTQVAGSPSQRLPSKLKILKFKLKNWNWEVLGDIRHKLAMLQEMIVQNEEVVQKAWSNEVEEELHQLKKDLQQVLRWDEELLYQKTREKWISEGDKNSKFFHALIRGRRSRNKIQLYGPHDTIVHEPQAIGEMAVAHFQDLFSATQYYLNDDLFDGFPAQVTSTMNMGICQAPSEEEIWEAVRAISADSAPGEDGFTGHFFKICWDIIKSDVVDMVRGFFMGDYLHKDISNTLLTLLPKVENRNS